MAGYLKLAAVAYLLVVNLLGFGAMGADKRRAGRGKWRIPEARLFLYAVLGGSVGSIAGMWAFRHKTKHWYFKYGMPLILLVQVGLAIWLIH